MNILYCFLTHQKHLSQTQERVAKMMKDLPYIIVVGGYSHSEKKENTLYLTCNDTYPGLPEKVLTLFHHIHDHIREFEQYDYFVKLDEDMILRQPLRLLPGFDYLGKVEKKPGNRRWHLGKCPGSYWNHTPYQGIYVPWCLGGCGYVVSKKVVGLLRNIPLELSSKDIYEDLMIAKILFYHRILPREIPIHTFIQSPTHS